MSAPSEALLLPDWLMPEGRSPTDARSFSPPRVRRFLAVPAEEVTFLRSTLGLYLGRPRVEELLRLFGRRLGRSMATLDPEAPEVGDMVCQLGAQVGLGKLVHLPTGPDPVERGPSDNGVVAPWNSRPSGAGWVLTMERLAEPIPPGPEPGRPEFTAGFLEGLFEGVLGGRVHGELHPQGEGCWALTVELLPREGPELRGTARCRLPEARAFRLEVSDASEFYSRISPYVVPGATLGFTREPPRRLRTEFGFSGVDLHWFAITYRPGESIISPRQVGHVVEIVESYLTQHPAPALVFLQGLDYLANRNEPQTVVRLVEVVQERVIASGGILVVEVPTEELDPEVTGQLRRELSDLLPSDTN